MTTNITVNGRPTSVTGDTISYEELVALAYLRADYLYTVSVIYLRDDKKGRIPVPGESVEVREGMVVNVADTSRA